MYKRIIKPILFLMSPDFVHRMTMVMGRAVQFFAPVRALLRKWWRYDHPNLSQNIFGIDFKNPVGLSAGLDKNVELVPLMESVGFGFESGGSVTLAPRKGNPHPWFHRLPKTGSLVIHAGMANKGLDVIGKNIKRNRPKVLAMPLMVSVAVVSKTTKETCDDAIIDARNTTLYVLQHKLAQAIEINISCPNVGDDQPFTEPEMLERLLESLDSLERHVPFFIKMPNLKSIRKFDALLKVIVRHNIQGVTIANLVKNRKEVDLKEPLADEVKGGFSGLPTKERSLALINHTYNKYHDKLIIIGVGGIFSAEDAYEKIKAGANLLAMITGVIFEGPQLVGQINKQLVELLKRDGYRSISDAVGANHKNLKKSL
ncbi:dihydroorotate dehydrogenase (quinone) [Candidatus Saccharibacteria bacterium]|nr:MAG: dihydroorotate dehydrogenase (quinone) [Candidatus Saccharibacteria bacterium]